MKKHFQIVVGIYFIITPCLHGQNAGILPYAYKEGKAYFLFGLEYRARGKKPSEWLWSDFGGRCEVEDIQWSATMNIPTITNGAGLSFYEPNIQYCAARECTEETRYVFGNKPLDPKRRPKVGGQLFKTSLQFWLDHQRKVFLQIDKKTNQPFYFQFFAQVDYKDPQALNNGPKVQNYEKREYIWVPVADVLNTAQQKQPRENFQLPKSSTGRDNSPKGVTKLLPLLADLFKKEDVQNYITTILAGETILSTEPITLQVSREVVQLSKDLNRFSTYLQQLMRQLQTLS